MLVSCMSHSPWKRRTISLDMPLIHFSFFGAFIRCRYSWAFPVFGQMTVFSLPGCKVRFPVAWSITTHSFPDERTSGDVLLSSEV